MIGKRNSNSTTRIYFSFVANPDQYYFYPPSYVVLFSLLFWIWLIINYKTNEQFYTFKLLDPLSFSYNCYNSRCSKKLTLPFHHHWVALVAHGVSCSGMNFEWGLEAKDLLFSSHFCNVNFLVIFFSTVFNLPFLKAHNCTHLRDFPYRFGFLNFICPILEKGSVHE